MTDEYLKSDEYKKKYDDLMQRCADFMKEFAPPSSYELGFKAGWEAALDSLQKVYVNPNQQVPAQTRRPTTLPFPPSLYQDTYDDTCKACGINMTNMTHYVCTSSRCPPRFKFTA